jgi:HNH endonuclease
MPTKICARCRMDLPVTSFHTRSNGRPDSYCRPCTEACRGTRVGGERVCPDCGKTFFAKRGGQKVCSYSCKSVKRDQAGERNPNWKGSHVGTRGYTYISRPGHPRAMKSEYVKRADLVAEEMLGRPLRDDEIVHHKNHDRLDDRPENLAVLTFAEHMALHAAERREAAEARKIQRPVGAKKIDWPPKEELLRMLEGSTWREVGKKLGCSHVAVYKRVKLK